MKDITPEQIVNEITEIVKYYFHENPYPPSIDGSDANGVTYKMFSEIVVRKFLKDIKTGGVVAVKYRKRCVLTPQFEAFLNGKES